MQNQLVTKNAVAAIRVSSIKQGTDGDSPEDQKEQIERFAQNHNIAIKKFFVFLESASKDQQPMQEAIDYCKDSRNGVQLFIIKSIDRFTRGGSFSYDFLKMQLEQYDVQLVDIYGIINSQKVNTLDHLGVSYKWSVYSPSKKAEILEAERAKDEMRDIMSRMIGAEVRYTRMGYWMRQPPYGLESHKVDTANGKRCILKSHSEEAPFILKMFELRCRGTLSDQQIIDYINELGYKSRTHSKRDKRDRTIITGHRGGVKLTLKQFWLYIQNPIYAGVNCEKWTDNKPVKCKFNGLVSYDTFNKANKGKLIIEERDGQITLSRHTDERYLVPKGSRNPDFPYKKIVMCSDCSKPLFGSASRGKMGQYYPAYHCNKRGHYFRVPSDEFENTIKTFVGKLTFSQDHVEALVTAVEAEWNNRQQSTVEEEKSLDVRINELKAQARTTADKIRFLSSEAAIKYMEEDLVKLEDEINALANQKAQRNADKPTDFGVVMKYIKYFLEHLDYLLLKQIDPVKKANFFGLIFNQAPTYAEIVSGTQNIASLTGVNELFQFKNVDKSNMVTPGGVEPPLPG